MNTPSGMREYGIMTTAATRWVHVFPLSCQLYHYPVQACRDYIERNKLPVKLGHSKDGAATGNGYLIPKKAYFVSRVDIPKEFLWHASWAEMTDRECGFAIEPVVLALIDRRVLQIPIVSASPLRTREAQLSSRDAEVSWLKPVTLEIKTERVEGTPNLFVQTHEGGHRVHLVRAGSDLVTRETEAPAWEESEIPF